MYLEIFFNPVHQITYCKEFGEISFDSYNNRKMSLAPEWRRGRFVVLIYLISDKYLIFMVLVLVVYRF